MVECLCWSILNEKHVPLCFLTCLGDGWMANPALMSTISHHFRTALGVSKMTTHLDCGFWFFNSLF